MRRPVIAIGLDSADPVLVESWISQGHLKNLNRLKQEGTYSHLSNTVNYGGVPTETGSTERLWTMVWTGCRPDKTGFWDTSKFYPHDYHISRDEEEVGANFNDYPPFYALGEDYKVAVFDLPATGLSEQVNGLQILAWGGHYPFTPSHSMPENLLPELIEEYGKNEVLNQDDGLWFQPKYAKWLEGALMRSVATRKTICHDLMGRDDWDLFITTFPEIHSAGHDLLHLSQPDHPLYPAYKEKVSPDHDPALAVYEAVDQALGEILDNAPANANIICFSSHGMDNNVTDVLSMIALPELMYRYNFPGKQALTPDTGKPLPSVITNPIRNSWAGEIWVKNYEPNPIKRVLNPWTPKQFLAPVQNGLCSPWALEKEGVPVGWIPGMWYSKLWPTMKAFALPAFVDGQIRINLKGRERDGIVEPSEYDAVCEEITDILYRLKHARTGERLVDKVVKTRRYPTEDCDHDNLPGPDLIVLWNKTPRMPADAVESPDFGRIGPFPNARPGGHQCRGFCIAKGPDIAAGEVGFPVEGVDIAPTILSLLGAPIDDRFDGTPIGSIVRDSAMVEV